LPRPVPPVPTQCQAIANDVASLESAAKTLRTDVLGPLVKITPEDLSRWLSSVAIAARRFDVRVPSTAPAALLPIEPKKIGEPEVEVGGPLALVGAGLNLALASGWTTAS
jgi:hypothetical protein